MTADEYGLMTSNNNAPPQNSSAVVTGAQRWSPFLSDAGPGSGAFSGAQQQQGSRSTVVSGFGVYANPSSRTVTTSHLGQGYPSVVGSIHLSGLPTNQSASNPNSGGAGGLSGNDTDPSSESQRASLQALMSQLAGSNTASAAFLSDPNNPVTQILMGIDNAANANGGGNGNPAVQFSPPYTSTSLDKMHTEDLLDMDVKEQKTQQEGKETKNAGDGTATAAAAAADGSGGKAYGVRNRKLKLPEEVLREEAAGEAGRGPRGGTVASDEGTDGEFKKGVDQFDQDVDFSDEDDDDDEYDEDEDADRSDGGGKTSLRKRERKRRTGAAAAASGPSGVTTRRQHDSGDVQHTRYQDQKQQQGHNGNNNNTANGGGGGTSSGGGGYTALPVGNVGRPRGFTGDPDFESLGEDDRRRLKRRIANRESARRVRAKRQEMMDELQQKITALSHQNARLLAHIANAEQNRQSLQSQLSVVRERFAMKLQENNNLLTETAALRHALQDKGINPAEAIADLVKHAHQQQQQQHVHGNGNAPTATEAALNAVARASSLIPGHHGRPEASSAFLSSAFNSLPTSTQAMLSAFSAPMGTQPAATSAAAAAAATMLPPVTTAAMAPSLAGFNI